MLSSFIRSLIVALAMVIVARPAAGAVFTYQGVLKTGGSPLNGTVDLRIRLYGAAGGGIPIGTVPINAVAVADGLFKVDLDFGASAFNGNDRWLEIDVANPANGGVGPFTTLTPRQRVTFAPMAQHALNASLSGAYGNAVTFSNAANAFTGSGAGLTNLSAGNLTGTIGSGLLNGTYGNALTLNNVSNAISGTFTGNGSGLSSLNASSIGSGNLSAARLPASGQWLISDLLRIDSSTLSIDPVNDRVGIGVIVPTHTLDVNGSMSIDGTTLNVDDVNNRVGVGTSSPLSRFHVVGSSRLEGQMTFDGTATFVDVPLIPVTTRYLAVAPCGFRPTGNDDFIATISHYCPDTDVLYGCMADLHLPQGATITSVTVWAMDASAVQNMTISVLAMPLNSSAAVSLASQTPTGSSSTMRTVSMPMTKTVDNFNESVFIYASWIVPTTPQDLRLQGARVTYTIDEPLP